MSKPVRLVHKTNSNNSVWLCESIDGPELVIKSFSDDTHAAEHLKAEVSFISANKEIGWIPRMTEADFRGSYFALSYLVSSSTPSISVGELLETYTSDNSKLSLVHQVHEEPPGILGWGRHAGSNSPPIETVIRGYLSLTDWFAPLIVKCQGYWHTDQIVHGDLKLRNLILSEDSFSIIDWESVCHGNLNWDVAGLIQSLISEIVSGGPLSNWARAQITSDYVSMCLKNEEVSSFMAIRAVQTANEFAQSMENVPKVTADLLQVAEDLATGTFSFDRIDEYV